MYKFQFVLPHIYGNASISFTSDTEITPLWYTPRVLGDTGTCNAK